MNIVSVKNIQGQQDYLLQEENKTVLKLRYKEESHAIRMETAKERRVLLIEDEGLLKSKFVLKNEYGVRLGSLSYLNFSDTQGSVDIENAKFRFTYQNSETPEINIYKGSRRDLIYNCRLLFDDIRSKQVKWQSASVIIAVSWYLFVNSIATVEHGLNEAVIL